MKQRHSFEERDSINAWFKLPKYRIWKYLIIGDAIALILLILATIIWMDSLAWQTVMVLRGCAGVLGIIFVVIAAIYYYLVYKDYIANRFDPRRKSNRNIK